MKGFTLLEILIALSVFAILAVLTSSAIFYAFDSKTRVGKQADQLNALELATLVIQRDFEQVANRPVRGNEMALFPAFVGEAQYMEFTRAGFLNPNSEEKRSNLKRIALLCKNDQLLERSFVTLDSVNRSNYHDTILLTNLKHCDFKYLNNTLQVLAEWRGNAFLQNQHPETFPKAVQLNLTLKNWGKASLLFILPLGLYGFVS